MVRVKSHAVKNIIAQEPGMLGPWIKVMEVVKQKMARVNTNILGINELKWQEWVNIINITIISMTMGKNPLEEMK